MSLRTLSTVRRASQKIARPRHLSLRGSCRSFITANPALAAVTTTSIGKTKGVDGPNVSAYSPPKHLGVHSGLTPEQVQSREWAMANYRLKLSRSVSMIELPMPLLFSSRLRIITGMLRGLTSEVFRLRHTYNNYRVPSII